MLARTPAAARRRRGVTLVEAALLLSIFLLFLMGIFEYSRLLMTLHVCTNAARSGARYACVNSDKDATFVTADDATTGAVCVDTYTRQQMGGTDKTIAGFAVAAFPCDNAALYQNPPVVQPKASYTAWNDASFTERIAVRITGQYKPVLPVFVFFLSGNGSTIPLSIAAASGSEG